MEATPPRPDHVRALQAASELAKACQYDARHIQQVTRLALELFDHLRPLHLLGVTERYWLESAAVLHDIGWVNGQKSHHKNSLQIILTTPILPLDQHERLIIGSIARYHRKALPKLSHDHFASLKPDEQEKVRLLAAILRVADGLDQTHNAFIQSMQIKIGDSKVTLCYTAERQAKDEEQSASEKSDLFEQVYHRRLKMKFKESCDKQGGK